MPDATLPSIDLGAASGGARQYDPIVAANPDQNATFGLSDVLQASANEMMETGPVANLNLLVAGTSYGGGQVLTADQANWQYGIKGDTPETSLQWKPGETVPEAQARLANEMTTARIQDEYITSRRPQTWPGWTAAAAGDFLGSALDPLNTAASFLPVSWLGRGAEVSLRAAQLTQTAEAAAAATRAMEASAAGRITASGLQNAGAVALMQPIIMAGAQADHADYTFTDAAQNVLFASILGAGIHGAGELLGAGLRHLSGDATAPPEEPPANSPSFDLGAIQDGSTARGMIRAGAAAMDSTHALSPEAAQDMAAASRPQVIADLTEQLGRAPTEDEIAGMINQRSDDFLRQNEEGKYTPDVQPLEPIADANATPDRIQKAIDQGDYATAAKFEQDHVAALEMDPAFKLAEEDKAEANAPVSQLSTIRNLINDFTQCVANESL